MRDLWTRFRPPTLQERFSARGNGLGLLRLLLACLVLLSHAWTLGFGWPGLGPLGSATHAQANSLTVYGFFVISGFLVAGSGQKASIGRFTWHRFLRIFPGFWACLLVTAFVLAPFVAAREHQTVQGFWSQPGGPLRYLWTNWFTSMDQYGIGSLLRATTPYGHITGGSVFDGSLWSLKYELGCYAVIALAAVTGILRRQPRVILGLAVLFYLVLAAGFVATFPTAARPVLPGAVGPIPLLGSFNVNQTVYLGFLFLLGAVLRLYQHRVPMHGALAGIAAVLLGVTLFAGGYVLIGIPAYAYLLLYLAVATPKAWTAVGRRRDYSYGVYLYAFPVEQIVSLLGGARWGLVPYILISAAGTFALAIPSWHLIERPAMRLKDHRVKIRISFDLHQRHVPPEESAVSELVPETVPVSDRSVR